MPANGPVAKAKLRVVQGEPSGRELAFFFNPTEYSVSRGADWGNRRNSPAATPARAQFNGVKPITLHLSVLLDAVAARKQDVTDDVKTLFSWLQPAKPGRHAEPPLLELEWGGNTTLSGLQCYLSQVEVKYTLFQRNGAPMRATVSLSLEEQPKGKKKQNPTSGSLVNGRTHVVGAGESLQSLAYREYGDATVWRVIAERNGIDDPLRVKAGMTLMIPSPDERSLSSERGDG